MNLKYTLKKLFTQKFSSTGNLIGWTLCIVALGLTVVAIIAAKAQVSAQAIVFGLEHPERMFGGGRPIEFIGQIMQNSTGNWSHIVSIPPSAYSVSVPIFVTRESDPIKLLEFYNRLSQVKPEMGKWVWDNDNTKRGNFNYLMLTQEKPSSNPPQPEWKTKAFGVRDIPENKWDQLTVEVHQITEEYMNIRRSDPSIMNRFIYQGVMIHKESAVLIAHGTPNFIDFVESMLAASRTNAMVKLEKP